MFSINVMMMTHYRKLVLSLQPGVASEGNLLKRDKQNPSLAGIEKQQADEQASRARPRGAAGGEFTGKINRSREKMEMGRK